MLVMRCGTCFITLHAHSSMMSLSDSSGQTSMANTKLWEFQTAGVKHLKGRSACLFDEPGLGKTVMSIYANIDASDTGPVLVITPLRNKLFFAASILHWTEVHDVEQTRTQSPANEPVVIVAETAGRFDVQEFKEAQRLRRRTWLITHWAEIGR